MLPAYLFWENENLVALGSNGSLVDVSKSEPEYKNVSYYIGWRLRDGSEPELADGKLIANAITVGNKLKLQVCLTSGTKTSIPADDGFLFPLYGFLTPSIYAVQYHLGGIGPVFMNSRDNGSMAGSYFGVASLTIKKIDDEDMPCVAVYYVDDSPKSHMTPISAVAPFNWRSATEGGNWLSFSIEYEISVD